MSKSQLMHQTEASNSPKDQGPLSQKGFSKSNSDELVFIFGTRILFWRCNDSKGNNIHQITRRKVQGWEVQEPLSQILIQVSKSDCFMELPLFNGHSHRPEEEKVEIRSAAAIYFTHLCRQKDLALVVLCLTETLHQNSYVLWKERI